MNLQKLDDFHKTRRGYAVFGVIELAMAWGFADWALDTGAWWLWVITAFLLLGVAQNLFHVIFYRRPKK